MSLLKVRSTTQRRGMTVKPFWAGRVVLPFIPLALRRASSTKTEGGIIWRTSPWPTPESAFNSGRDPGLGVHLRSQRLHWDPALPSPARRVAIVEPAASLCADPGHSHNPSQRVTHPSPAQVRVQAGSVPCAVINAEAPVHILDTRDHTVGMTIAFEITKPQLDVHPGLGGSIVPPDHVFRRSRPVDHHHPHIHPYNCPYLAGNTAHHDLTRPAPTTRPPQPPNR